MLKFDQRNVDDFPQLVCVIDLEGGTVMVWSIGDGTHGFGTEGSLHALIAA